MIPYSAMPATSFPLSSIQPARRKVSHADFARRVPHQGFGMMRHGLVLLTFCAALMGCAAAPAQERRPIAWDGLGQNPNRPVVTKRRVTNPAPVQADPNQERERVLGTLRPYSEAWWAVHDEIEAENDRQLGTKLVICPRCVPTPSPSEDATGSIR
jgi:hypothetical protein